MLKLAMIEYIIPESPDDRILKKAAEILMGGGLIAFPTDTSWTIAGDPFHKDVIKKLQKLKGVSSDKHFSLLCDHISRASEYAVIDDSAFKIIKRIIPGHYTFIFEATKKITKSLKANKSDHEVGLRFPPSLFCRELIEIFDRVLIATNITPEMLALQPEDFIYSALIEDKLMHELKMIIDPGEIHFQGQSTIIRFSPEIELVRAGAGDYSFLV